MNSVRRTIVEYWVTAYKRNSSIAVCCCNRSKYVGKFIVDHIKTNAAHNPPKSSYPLLYPITLYRAIEI